jgi:hypothetical protein
MNKRLPKHTDFFSFWSSSSSESFSTSSVSASTNKWKTYNLKVILPAGLLFLQYPQLVADLRCETPIN